MALTNYASGTTMDPVNAVGGQVLQLGIDAMYSLLMWGISFVQTNFVLILIGVAITIVAGLAIRKLRGKARGVV